ncbi:hypothetical protein HUA76_41225 [Myxococcus sp. CA056]|nr:MULTISPECIES: hypothetical protein [unclassified Myxococcus]NTX17217.1 hypothetical protein [Myxococcus sp. CA056]NTX49723.1 hypothetical protein [Myxococcus sp. CA039A]
MTSLAALPTDQKKINCVWIGNGLISCQSAFNILSWISCGWTVTIYKHPAPQGNAAVSAIFHEDARSALESPKVTEETLSVVSLTDALEAATTVMPTTRALLRRWIGDIGVGYTSYAIGDLTKSFIAGTRVGIVLDLKIGPSQWVHDYPSKPFTETFISFSRTGAFDVENQCLGSLNLEVSNEYGQIFDLSASGLENATFDQQTNAEAVFGSITSKHQLAFNNLKRKRKGTDVKTTDSTKWEFFEIGSNKNSGPFRVYQKPGYFNWKQGEYPEQKKENLVLVADELKRDHGTMQNTRVPAPFKHDSNFYLQYIQPLAHESIKDLRTTIEKIDKEIQEGKKL